MRLSFVQFIFFGIFIFQSCKQSDENLNSDKISVEIQGELSSLSGTKKCLVGYDWVYPNKNDMISAWSFAEDSTFNFSTTLFGGMSAWGRWSVQVPGKVKITYTRTTKEALPADQILNFTDCNKLTLGSTDYLKVLK